MKIHDISQEVFSCEVYPGDAAPRRIEELRMSQGSVYNLTSFSMNAHNGTHLDAPFHFYQDGKTVEQLSLEKTVGPCYVARQEGAMTAAEAASILEKAGSSTRILLKGDALVTLEAAEVFAWAKIDLLGVESQSVGPMDAPMAVHRVLLGEEIALLEGLRLTDVREGRYILSAAPLNLSGSDGAPCRAILMECE